MGEVCPVTRLECDILSALKKAHSKKNFAAVLGDPDIGKVFEEKYDEVARNTLGEYCVDDDTCGVLAFTEMDLTEKAVLKIEHDIRSTRRRI